MEASGISLSFHLRPCRIHCSEFASFLSLWAKFSSWWLNQPLWNILVKMGIFPQIGVKIKKSLKPPPSFGLKGSAFIQSFWTSGALSYMKYHIQDTISFPRIGWSRFYTSLLNLRNSVKRIDRKTNRYTNSKLLQHRTEESFITFYSYGLSCPKKAWMFQIYIILIYYTFSFFG